jgi:hypothetical protein
MKGLSAELFVSHQYHQNNLPLLISSKFMRKKSMSQIDVAYIDQKGEINIIEVKSSAIGLQVYYQRRDRLLKAQNYLSLLFNRKTNLRAFGQKLLPNEQFLL